MLKDAILLLSGVLTASARLNVRTHFFRARGFLIHGAGGCVHHEKTIIFFNVIKLFFIQLCSIKH